MRDASSREPAEILRKLTWPVAAAVVLVVALAWYVTWASSELTMGAVMSASSGTSEQVFLAFLLLVVMMVAMMLPSALPMVLTFHGLTRLAAGRVARRADRFGTFLFASAYFVVWGLFCLIALVSLTFLDLRRPLNGLLLLLPAGILVAAGAWQLTRTKEACLAHCQSPMGFVMNHWRSGRRGAWRMGLHHSVYCLGCCWLFMLVLFVSGSMSLLSMGVISLLILVEKIGWRPRLITRAIGAVLAVTGLILAVPILHLL